MEKRISVGDYDVVIAPGLLKSAGERLARLLKTRRVAVVTDTTVERLWLAPLLESLNGAGFDTVWRAFPAGEKSKNMATLADTLEFLAENRVTRTDAVLALGGGVTGDMTGFAAGCYLRGVDFVQLPTTFLAAVDSSVGGKTAVDLRAGKNLAGLFVRPKAVICDTDCLATLPDAVFADGAAEAVKTAVLTGGRLFELVKNGIDRRDLAEIIALCVEYKGKVVEADEFEHGERKLLNLGHTAGHAVELLSGYAVPHGHAVAVGTAIIVRAAAKRGICGAETRDAVISALRANKLPTATDFTPEKLAEAALSDKKRSGGEISLAIPRGVGDCFVDKAPVTELRALFADGTEV